MATTADGRDELNRLLGGYRVTQLLYVAARLGIADLVAHGAMSAAEIADAAGSHVDATSRFLAALADLGVLARSDGDTYVLTAMGSLLRDGQRGGLRAAALSYGSPWWWSAFGQLEASVRTGQTGFELVYGRPLFPWLADHPDAADVFNANMAAMIDGDVVLACGFPFAAVSHLVDVGGGRGQFARAFLKRFPAARASVIDRPDVVAGVLGECDAGIRDRLTVHGASFFNRLPVTGDAYLLKDILHDWDDDNAVRILHRCADAARPHGQIILAERLLNDADFDDAVRGVDITMLALTGGRERTRTDYTRLLTRAGLVPGGEYRAGGGYSLIAAHPKPDESADATPLDG